MAVEMLTGLSDDMAKAKSHQLYLQRKDVYDGFEVWDRTRFIVRHPDFFEASSPGEKSNKLGVSA